jgi:hypothetical protein
MTYVTEGMLGVNIADASSSTPAFAAGTTVTLSDGGAAMYVKASSTITAGDVLLVDSAGAAAPITTALTDAGTATAHKYIACAHVSITSGEYGWACRKGVPAAGISVLASCVRGSPLYTTSTAGALDDIATSSHLIAGIEITATATGAAVTAGFLSNPVLVSGTVNNT